MPKRNIAWIIVGAVVGALLWQVPRLLVQRDLLYREFSPLIEVQRQVLKNYAEQVDPQVLLRGAIDGVLDQLDPYSEYYSTEEHDNFSQMLEGQYEGIGIAIESHESGQILIVSPIEGSPAFKAGLRARDRIAEIDGQDTTTMTLEQGVHLIKGHPGTQVKLKLYRPSTDNIFTRTITRQVVTVPSVRGWARTVDWQWDYMIDPEARIGYIRIRSFEGNTDKQLDTVVRKLLNEEKLAGLVVDVRDNPGGLLEIVVNIVNSFVDEGLIVSTKGRNSPERIFRATRDGTYPVFPMAVLVNHGSASASEILAGSLKDHKRAVIVGEQTFGKGSVQQIFPLTNNYGAVKITTGYYYMPHGDRIHGQGVKPNLVVELTQEERTAMLESQIRVYSAAVTTSTRPTTTTAPATTGDDAWARIELDRQLEAALAHVKGQLKLATTPVVAK